MKHCRLCGRVLSKVNEEICDKCAFALCELCNSKLSRGYCAVCGKLICDDDSSMVGYARVCNDCLERDRNLSSYTHLREKIFNFKTSKRHFELVKVFESGERLLGNWVLGAIGLDDTDSPYGMCTTFLATLIIDRIKPYVEFLDYPFLVRLNPNVPFKTRGNASVKILFRTKRGSIGKLKEITIGLVSKGTHSFFPKTQTTVAFYFGIKKPNETALNKIYKVALTDILTVDEALSVAETLESGHLELYSSDEKARGVVGSLAALGADFPLFTYELLAYRDLSRTKSDREIDSESVKEVDARFREFTFANIDDGRVLITPNGPDPVLFGIRGYRPDILLEAARLIRGEKPVLWTIFKTNQGTNSHILEIECIEQARPYQSVRFWMAVDRVLDSEYKTVLEGHNCNRLVKVNIFRPLSNIRLLARKLVKGDLIEVVGNVVERRDSCTELNLEELKIVNLMPKVEKRNPLCPQCGSTLKSKGVAEYKCKRCGYRVKSSVKLFIIKERNNLPIGERVIPPARYWRHLTMPPNFDESKIFKEEKLITPIYGREL